MAASLRVRRNFAPPNGRGVVSAGKPRNVTSIPVRPTLHALLVEVDILFKDVEESFINTIFIKMKQSSDFETMNQFWGDKFFPAKP